MRGGKDYDSDFGKRMHGEGVWADLIRQRFDKAIDRLGVGGSWSRRFDQLDASRFKKPAGRIHVGQGGVRADERVLGITHILSITYGILALFYAKFRLDE